MEVTSAAEQLFFTTIRIDTITSSGQGGSGTGFFFSYKKGEDIYLFIVTNKHVVDGASEVQFTFHQRDGSNPKIGERFELKVDLKSFPSFGHFDDDIDIAIFPLVPMEQAIKKDYGIDIFYRYISDDMIPNQKQIDKIDALEAVTFIGYPNGLWDSKNLLPIARQGNTASPIAIDFEGEPKFIIDASVFGGSSGSPVFIFDQGSYIEKGGNLQAGTRLIFVGVIAAVFYHTEQNEIVSVPIPTKTVPMSVTTEKLDLGIVFKSRVVVETIEQFIKQNGVE